MAEILTEILTVKFLVVNVIIGIVVSIIANRLTGILKLSRLDEISIPSRHLGAIQICALSSLIATLAADKSFIAIGSFVTCVLLSATMFLAPHSNSWSKIPREGFFGFLDRIHFARWLHYLFGLIFLIAACTVPFVK